MKEFKIGEVFQFGKKKLKCVENTESLCDGCIFRDFTFDVCKSVVHFVGECAFQKRQDEKNVVFVEVKEDEG